MRTRLGIGLAALGLLAGGPGCGFLFCSGDAPTSASGDQRSSGTGHSSESQAATAIAEADIIQVDGSNLYAMSRSGTLSIVDIGTPGKLALKGATRLSGEPFELYRRGDVVVAMSTKAVNADGSIIAPKADPDSPAASSPQTSPIPSTAGAAAPILSSLVTVLDVSEPSQIRVLASFPVPGEIADSRFVGDVMYLATYENGGCYQCGSTSRTVITSFDARAPGTLSRVDQVSFDGPATQATAGWGMPWKRSLLATPTRLYVGGLAATASVTGKPEERQGAIDVIDVSDPGGHFVRGPRIPVMGPILSRWQMDETAGVLRVVSQQGVGATSNGVGSPMIETFDVTGQAPFAPLGKSSIKLPRQEGLRAVRFDGPRAYAITFNQMDPLFVLDLADPKNPRQRGELEMPGWMFHLEPHGDRVIGLGIDRTDTKGALNVSLFDVANADQPKMLSRVSFGPQTLEDYQIIDQQLPEDQDRIQKAFRVLEQGLVVVPYSTNAAVCQAGKGGSVQLIDWKGDSLSARASLPMTGNPRRAFQVGGELLAVSDSNVTAFALAGADARKPTADLVIGKCTVKSATYGVGGGGGGMNEMPGGGGCLP